MKQCVVLFMLLSTLTLEAKLVLYVSPRGNDRWSGRSPHSDKKSNNGPFLTLQRAVEEIETLKKAGKFPEGGITIEIMGGTHQILEKIAIEGCSGLAVRGNGKVILTGGRKITKWKKVRDRDILNRLDKSVRDKIFKTNLKEQGITNLGDFSQPNWATSTGSQMFLYFNGKPMQIARWPDEDFALTGQIKGKGKFHCNAELERLEKWREEKSLRAFGYWFFDWAPQHMEIESVALPSVGRPSHLPSANEPVDPETGVISLKNPDSHEYGYKEGARYFIYNALCEITRPGEWYLDASTGDLYFYPPSSIERGEALVSVNEQPMIELRNCSGVRIENIVFETSRKEAIVIQDCSQVSVAKCVFRNLGGWAIRAHNVKESTIRDCDIYNVGEGGIYLEGGDRKTLTAGNNRIANNHIRDFSLWIRVYRPAVQINGVGNLVSNNLIHDAPHMAIGWAGNDNIIEFNEIYNVVLETSDAGAIYSGRDPSMQGNIIRYNYFHDIGRFVGQGVASVYLDDGHCGNIVYGNIFYRACVPGHANFGAVFIHGGRYNVVENNIFIECQQAYNETPWSQEMWKSFWANPPYNERLFGEIDLRKEPYLSKYPWLANILEDTRPNVLARNIVYNCKAFIDRGKQELVDNFVDVKPEWFEICKVPCVKLRGDSPPIRAGFKQIPCENMGLKRR